jgi:ABC-type amino acid transport substrate-binding protein
VDRTDAGYGQGRTRRLPIVDRLGPLVWRTVLVAVSVLVVTTLVWSARAPAAPAQADSSPGSSTTPPTAPGAATAPTAPTAPTAATGRAVRVAVRVLPPFVEKRGDRYTGFTIDLWEQVAARNGWETTYVEVPSVRDQLAAVEEGRADIAATAISVTSDREEVVDFSHPYFDAGLQIMVPADEQVSIGSALRSLFSSSLLTLFAIFFGAMLVVGLLVAAIERRSNPDFAHGGPRAFAEGVWWALVTVVTVGYGDRVTRTTAGRLIAAFWMIFGLIFVAQLTATVTATLTARELRSSIRGPQDLGGQQVVTVSGTTGAQYLRERGIAATEVADVPELTRRVLSGEADAAVYDAPVLAYEVSRSGSDRLTLVGSPFTTEFYAMALPAESPLTEDVDTSLLELGEEGLYERLRAAWFPV